VKPEPKPAPRREQKPAPKAEPKPAPKGEPKPEPKPAVKAEPKPELEPAPKEESKPEPQPEATSGSKPEAERAREPAFELASDVDAESALEPEQAPTLDLAPGFDAELALRFESEPGAAAPEPETERGTDVDALFERIRAGREERAATIVDAGVSDRAAPAPAPIAEVVAEPQAAAAVDAELLASRDEALAPIAEDLLRRCKRVLQDEQNEVLDALRRHRGRLTADKLLPSVDEQVANWAEVMTPAIDGAYVAARVAASSLLPDSPVVSAPRRIVTGLVEVVVAPLQERLLGAVEQTLADDPDSDADAIAHRIGARYREWRGQELDGRIGDVLAAAYARGIYDAAPEGSALRWVPAEPGQCPDAEDNALEPTTRGERFPTGQPFPPAHPGCRCLLAVIREH
jgi:hypothetical protein